MVGSLTVSVHAQARDRTQKILGCNIGADLAGAFRGFKERSKCGFESLLEVRGQGVEGRVSRMQGRGQSSDLVAIKAAYRCIHLASASPDSCSAAKFSAASAQASIS